MSRLTVFGYLALPCLVLLAPAPPAQAQAPSDIHHCIGTHGAPVFTDQPCAALHATPVSAASATASPAAVTVSPAQLCSASVDELRQNVIDAFARRDSVRLAGLILWDGYASGAVIADIRALTTLMKQPLLEVDAAPPPAASPASDDGDFVTAPGAAKAARPTDQLLLRSGRDGIEGSAPQWRFDIVRRSGCLWLRNAN
ncbi:MAG: DUF4124 domain-containing protein [Rhodanobacter sp.]